MPENRLNIHVIADSSGESAARIARAAKAQFPKLTIDIISHPRIKDAEKAIAAFREIAKSSETNPDLPIVVLYTFVNPEMRALIKQLCEENQLQHADLLGDTLAAMANATGRTADGVPMRPVFAEADYFDRISAMEFAVRNDDGVMPSASVRLPAKTLLLSFFFFLFLDADIKDARDDKFHDGKDCKKIVLFGHEA